MIDREKVIKGLECCAEDCVDGCPYENIEAEGWNCTTLLCRDALELLKAQEPRVMTLEELKEGESYWFIAWGDFILRPVICVHREDDAQKPYIVFTWQYGTFPWESEDYGKRWRCWSSRPSAAEMEAVPWESVK